MRRSPTPSLPTLPPPARSWIACPPCPMWPAAAAWTSPSRRGALSACPVFSQVLRIAPRASTLPLPATSPRCRTAPEAAPRRARRHRALRQRRAGRPHDRSCPHGCVQQAFLLKHPVEVICFHRPLFSGCLLLDCPAWGGRRRSQICCQPCFQLRMADRKCHHRRVQCSTCPVAVAWGLIHAGSADARRGQAKEACMGQEVPLCVACTPRRPSMCLQAYPTHTGQCLSREWGST